jgi:hypothetical protein
MKNYVLILLVFPLFLQSQKSKPQKLIIVAYREPEIMYGNIKQVIEKRPYFHTDVKLPLFDTTTFDRKTNPIETRLGDKEGSCGLVLYQLSNDKSGKKIETIIYSKEVRDIFKFDSGSHLTKSRPNKAYYTSYTVDDVNGVIEAALLGANKKIGVKEKYKYHEGVLSELDIWSKLKELRGKNFYKYLSIDKNGNWTKRIVIYKNENSGPKADTVVRKITYY